jgi:hypothetical protein
MEKTKVGRPSDLRERERKRKRVREG